jgi:hypothetical protein
MAARGSAGKAEGTDRTFIVLVFAAFVLFMWTNDPNRVDAPVDTLEKALRLAGRDERLTRFAWDHQPMTAFGLGDRRTNRFVLVLMSRCAPNVTACNGTALTADIDAWKLSVRSVREWAMARAPPYDASIPKAADALKLPVGDLPQLLRAASMDAPFLDFLATSPPPFGLVHRCERTCVLVAGAGCTPRACEGRWRLEVEPSTGRVLSSGRVEPSGGAPEPWEAALPTPPPAGMG